MNAKSPSKLIIFGEHAIVYPDSKAIITALGLYTISSSRDNKDLYHINFISDKLKLDFKLSSQEAIKIYKEGIKIREEYFKSGDIKKLKSYVRTEGNFFKIIIGYLSSIYKDLRPLRIDFTTNIPLGSGLGSSASIAAALITTILKENNIKYSKEDLFELTKASEDFAHGSSSGIDPACVINGGLLSYEHLKDGSKRIKKLSKEDEWSKDLYLVHTGYPKEGTAEMVNRVKEYKINNEDRFKIILNEIKMISNEFITSNDPDMNGLINRNGLLLEEMGVVNNMVKEFCDSIRKKGGAAKLSGAGGRVSGSGMVLIKFNDNRILKMLLDKYNFKLIKAKFQVKGIN
jgi:mevalonate kinase